LNPDEPDAALRAAALRKLKTSDPRILSDLIVARIATVPVPERIGMLDLVAGIYRKLGGTNNVIDYALAEQIRSSDTSVAAKAIFICSTLGIQESYLPMRELASSIGSPLRKEAIEGISRLHDARAIVFFKTLLEADSAPRTEIYRALAELGRPAAVLLKSKLDDPRPEERRMALDALLGMATDEDLSALYGYIQKHPPQGDLKTRIYDKIATLEAKQYERPLKVKGD
jgi:HEAT repeat protein